MKVYFNQTCNVINQTAGMQNYQQYCTSGSSNLTLYSGRDYGGGFNPNPLLRRTLLTFSTPDISSEDIEKVELIYYKLNGGNHYLSISRQTSLPYWPPTYYNTNWFISDVNRVDFVPTGNGSNSVDITDLFKDILDLGNSGLMIREPSIFSDGIVGFGSRLYYPPYLDIKIFKPVLSGTVSDEFGNPIRDADITISNGTTYTTTTDENGAYSQVVDADTYDIAVSKSHSTFHDTSESVSVSADTTKNITMPTDRIAGKHKLKGMSIPGGISL